MLLSALLRPGLIKVGLGAESQGECISELVDVLIQEHEIAYGQREAILEQIYAQNRVGTSGMQNSIAVPHAAVTGVEDFLVALGTAPKGVAFDCIDGKPARLVVLLLAPKSQVAGEVKLLSSIERLLEHPGLIDTIVEAGTPHAVYNAIAADEKAAQSA